MDKRGSFFLSCEELQLCRLLASHQNARGSAGRWLNFYTLAVREVIAEKYAFTPNQKNGSARSSK